MSHPDVFCPDRFRLMGDGNCTGREHTPLTASELKEIYKLHERCADSFWHSKCLTCMVRIKPELCIKPRWL